MTETLARLAICTSKRTVTPQLTSQRGGKGGGGEGGGVVVAGRKGGGVGVVVAGGKGGVGGARVVWGGSTTLCIHTVHVQVYKYMCAFYIYI